jgi:hypothetical protein
MSDDNDRLRAALREFVHTIDATGGVLRLPSGHVAPAADEDWIDLGESYLKACCVLKRLPMIYNEDE